MSESIYTYIQVRIYIHIYTGQNYIHINTSQNHVTNIYKKCRGILQSFCMGDIFTTLLNDQTSSVNFADTVSHRLTK